MGSEIRTLRMYVNRIGRGDFRLSTWYPFTVDVFPSSINFIREFYISMKANVIHDIYIIVLRKKEIMHILNARFSPNKRLELLVFFLRKKQKGKKRKKSCNIIRLREFT